LAYLYGAFSVIFTSKLQFNYWFTYKTVLLSSNGCNFKTIANIVTKFALYVARILLCETCKFGEKIFDNN